MRCSTLQRAQIYSQHVISYRYPVAETRLDEMTVKLTELSHPIALIFIFIRSWQFVADLLEVGNSLHIYWQVGNSLHIYWQVANSACVGSLDSGCLIRALTVSPMVG